MSVSKPWYNNFPCPSSTPRSISDEEVATLIQDPNKIVGQHYIIVDVRRTDFGVFLIKEAG